jgi:hypothetical protein
VLRPPEAPVEHERGYSHHQAQHETLEPPRHARTRHSAAPLGVSFPHHVHHVDRSAWSLATRLDDPVGYVAGASSDNRISFGAFLELLLIIANIGTAVVPFPILRRENEILAVGYVAARIMECTFILVGILAVLSIVALRQETPGGDVGAIAYTLAAVLVMFGVFDRGGTGQGIATIPDSSGVGLGIYLTVWGFKPSPITAGFDRDIGAKLIPAAA